MDISEFTSDSGYIESVKQRNEITKERSSPTKPKMSSPVKQKPSSPVTSPSFTTATNIMGKVKGLAHSPRKSATLERRGAVSPASDHTSHSTAVQTSPHRSWSNIPGAIDDDESYFDESRIKLRDDTERKYFLYIIKDVNPFTRKECVGRVTLPARQRMTLEQLRNYLMQSEDETIRSCAKRRFKFLSESYRLVVMNETCTPVDQVYQTQGIFIKFSAGESLPYGYRSKNKYRTGKRDAIETESPYMTRNKSQLSSVTRSVSKKSESIYGSLRSTQQKESIYGDYRSSYGTTPVKSYAKSSIYGSTTKTADRSRFGWTPVKKEERHYAMERTPRKREERGKESMLQYSRAIDNYINSVYRVPDNFSTIYDHSVGGLSGRLSPIQSALVQEDSAKGSGRKRPIGKNAKFYYL